MTLPLVLLSWPASGVLLAILSRMDNRTERTSLISAAISLTANITFPLMTFVGLALDFPIRHFYSNHWAGFAADHSVAGKPVGAIQSIAVYNGPVLIERRKMKLNFILGVLNGVGLGLVFVFSVFFNLMVLVTATPWRRSWFPAFCFITPAVSERCPPSSSASRSCPARRPAWWRLWRCIRRGRCSRNHPGSDQLRLRQTGQIAALISCSGRHRPVTHGHDVGRQQAPAGAVRWPADFGAMDAAAVAGIEMPVTSATTHTVRQAPAAAVCSFRSCSAIAACLCRLGHASTLSVIAAGGAVVARAWRFPGGFGVDLLFLISGFIIVTSSRDLFRCFGAAASFSRRLIRVAPLYYAASPVYLPPPSGRPCARASQADRDSGLFRFYSLSHLWI